MILYCKLSVTVPVPPEPAVAVADTVEPEQIPPVGIEGVSVPATGTATIVQVIVLYPVVVQLVEEETLLVRNEIEL